MPKHSREEIRTGLQYGSVSDAEIDDSGHTPKWSRSSTSASPEPIIEPESSSAAPTGPSILNQEMQCLLPGHKPLNFLTATEFEVHYAKEHTNTCIECKANLPSEWLLNLHHRENHDPLVCARKDAGEKTYQCFLKNCDKITLTPQKRRLHLIDKHDYPRNYDFRIVDTGSTGKNSLLREQRTSQASGRRRKVSDVGMPGWRKRATDSSTESLVPTTSVDAHRSEDTNSRVLGTSKSVSTLEATSQRSPVPMTSNDDVIDLLTTSMSSLQFVPMSVRMKNQKRP